MDPQERRIRIEEEEARAAVQKPLAQRVLVISLLAVIILLSLVWVIPALFMTKDEQPPTVSAAVRQQKADNSTHVLLTNDKPPMETRADQRGAMDVTKNQSAGGSQ